MRIIREAHQEAGKAYQCAECLAEIETGESHACLVVAGEECIENIRLHISCRGVWALDPDQYVLPFSQHL